MNGLIESDDTYCNDLGLGFGGVFNSLLAGLLSSLIYYDSGEGRSASLFIDSSIIKCASPAALLGGRRPFAGFALPLFKCTNPLSDK